MTDSIAQGYTATLPWWHGSRPLTGLGASGELLPYTLAGDDYITAAVLVCLLIAVVVAVRAGRFLTYQTGNIFRIPRENSALLHETERERHPLLLFPLLTAALVALLTYSITTTRFAIEYVTTEYLTIGIFAAVALATILLAELVRTLANVIGFKKTTRHIASIERLYCLALDALLLLPITLLHLYFGLDPDTTMAAALWALVAVHALYAYKVWGVMFRKNKHLARCIYYIILTEALPAAAGAAAALIAINALHSNS